MVEKKRVENATMEESETDVEQALLLQSVLKYAEYGRCVVAKILN